MSNELLSKQINIKKAVDACIELSKEGKTSTMLGIGPMSENLIEASLELAKEMDFPMMYIASRNQVDADELGGGYVNGWDQFRFAEAIKQVSSRIGFDGLYYLCRDHGGPWQRDNERNDHLETEKAMELGKLSYLKDIEAGFDLLMIDPTKDPFEIGKVIELDVVLDRTVELIEYCEKERKRLGLPEIGYEVGTEETNGGLTSTEIYEVFINRLQKELESRGLPMPTFIVGQTGTLVRNGTQVGHFDFKNTLELAEMASKYSVGLKEHNGDYFDDITLLQHVPAKVTAVNVAPQYGTVETNAILTLIDLERKLKEEGLIKELSKVEEPILTYAIESKRWRKWVGKDQQNLSEEEIKADKELTTIIYDCAGHYTFNNDVVREGLDKLYKNLESVGVDGRRYVIDAIKKPIREYAEILNLRGLTSRIKERV